MIQALVLVVMMTAGGTTARAARPVVPPPDCGPILDGSLDIPEGWGISPSELVAMATEIPALRPGLRTFVRLARFVSEDGEEFFERFASYAYLGLAKATILKANVFRPSDLTDLLHRLQQLETLRVLFVRQSLLPDDLDDDAMAVIADAYGPLAWEDRAAATAAIATGQIGPALQKALAGVEFRFRDLVAHSSVVQAFVLAQVRDASSNHFGPEVTVPAWQRRMTGQSAATTDLALDALIDRAERLVRMDELPPRLDFRIPPGFGPAAARRFIERELIALGVTALLNEGFGATEWLKPDAVSTVLDDPLVRMLGFDRLLEQTNFDDRGLNPFLREVFATVMLRRPVMTAVEARARLAAPIKRRFLGLRKEWRAINAERAQAAGPPTRSLKPAATAIAPAAPSRTERLARYVPPARPDAATSATNPAPAAIVPADAPPQNDATAAFWANLADPSRDLREARAVFRAELAPDREVSLRVNRSGFVYRVEFSPELIEQLVEPAPGEPADVREWLAALAEGPARRERQRGWRKLQTLLYGRYRWEIKLRHEPYRILGLRLASGAWRFERVERTH